MALMNVGGLMRFFTKPGDTLMPSVSILSQVRGLEWDPFCPNNLATGGADGMVKLWSIPIEGLQADLVTPIVSLTTCEHLRKELALGLRKRDGVPITFLH